MSSSTSTVASLPADSGNYEYGTVSFLTVSNFGTTLTEDISSGVTDLPVDDPVDFDEDGGLLTLDGTTTLAYTGWSEDDAGNATITLEAPLAADMSNGDPVWVWDVAAGTVASTQTAVVVVDGEGGASITADCADTMIDRLASGASVRLEPPAINGGVWRIVDILGFAAAPTLAQQNAAGLTTAEGNIAAAQAAVATAQSDISSLNSTTSTIQGIITTLAAIWYGSTFPTIGTHPGGAEQGDLYIQPYTDAHGNAAKRLFVCQPGAPAAAPAAAGWIFLQLGIDGLVANFLEGQTITGVYINGAYLTATTAIASGGSITNVGSSGDGIVLDNDGYIDFFQDNTAIGKVQATPSGLMSVLAEDGSVLQIGDGTAYLISGTAGTALYLENTDDALLVAPSGNVTLQAGTGHVHLIGGGVSGVYLDNLTNATSLATGSAGQIVAGTSTERVKTNIVELTDAQVEAAFDIVGISAQWLGSDDYDDGTPLVGVVAEQAAAVLAGTGLEHLIRRDGDGMITGFEYLPFAGGVHQSMLRYLRRLGTAHQQQITALQQQNADISTRLAALEAAQQGVPS